MLTSMFMTATVWGVGFVGAGAATQAIHVPALARLRDRFAVRGVFDVDQGLAAVVAERCGAPVAPTLEHMLADPAVDVVCICSPERFHAEHAIAACEAGVKAVLCEKPLATSREEGERIAEASRRTGVPVLVGTMHRWDPVWRDAALLLADQGLSPRQITSSIVIPQNELFEDLSADLARPAALPPPIAETAAERIRRRLLLLSIHDLPLVRDFVDPDGEPLILDAGDLQPIGYHVTATVGDSMVQLIGSMRPHWDPRWGLILTGETFSLEVLFPPAFVQAGSASAVLSRKGSRTVLDSRSENGYVGEWQEIDRLLLTGDFPDPASIVNDLAFAITFADAAAGAASEEADR